jgi:tetratricopeptide (TPR) repeat protein
VADYLAGRAAFRYIGKQSSGEISRIRRASIIMPFIETGANRMKRILLIFTIILSFIVSASTSISAKETWTSIRSKNFVVIGNASEGDMRKVTTRLEQFRQVLSLLFPRAKIETPVPTTVVIFKDHDSFRPFKPLYKGKVREDVGGYFIVGQDMNYIALTADKSVISPFEVIFHEYEHFFLGNNLRNAPLWLNEGLAEYYSTFTTSDDEQKILLGQPIARHIITLRNSQLLPLKTLLTVDHKSPHYNEGSKAGIFYAESWALVHYLMLGNQEKRQSQFIRFIDQLNSDLPLEENFRQSFQVDYKGMEAELRAYIGRFMFPVLTGTFTRQIDFAKESRSAAMSEAEIQFYLGDLLLRTGRFDEAEQRLQKSLSLDPKFSSSQISLGILRLQQKRFEEAKKLLQDVIAVVPQSHLAHYYYALALARDQQYEEAIKSYKQSILLKPDLPRTYSDLGYAYLQLGREEDALEAYRKGVRLDPANPYFYRSFTYIYLRQMRGNLAATNALTYLKQQGWSDDHAPYLALAVYFGYRQAKRDDDAKKFLDEASTKMETSEWPYPVARYLQHAINEQELLALATDNDKLTEAHAYIGLELSLSGNRDAALTHLRWVKENGNKRFVEYALAATELSRIESATGSINK